MELVGLLLLIALPLQGAADAVKSDLLEAQAVVKKVGN